MTKKISLFAIVFLALAMLALYLAIGASHRGEGAMLIVLLFAALLFWKRSLRSQ